MPANSSTSNSKIKFLKRGLILLAVVVAMDQLCGLLLHQLYFSVTSGAEYETTYAFTKADADIIVTGSSKARRNYNTPLISDSLHISCYNAGHDGQSLLFSYAMTKMLLSHYTPKMIVVEMFPEELYYKEVHYDRLNVLLPYYNDFPEIREIADWRGTRNEDTTSIAYKLFPFNTEKMKLLSQSYRYNSMWLDLLKGKVNEQKTESGYLPLKNTITENKKRKYIEEFELTKSYEHNRHIDPNKIKSLTGIIELCKQKGVTVVLAMSPVLKRYDEDPVYKLVNEISLKYNVSFLDYTNDERFNYIQYFADNHMNKIGSTFFSSIFAHDLKSIIASSKN